MDFDQQYRLIVSGALRNIQRVRSAVSQTRREAGRRIRVNANTTAVRRGFRNLRREIRSVRREASQLNGVLSGIGAAFAGRELIRTLDTWTRINNQIRVYSRDQAQANQRIAELRAIADRTFAPLDGIAEGYSRIRAVLPNESDERIFTFLESLATGFAAEGVSGRDQGEAIRQISQSIAEGTIRVQEFDAANDRAAGTILEIGNAMGITAGRFRSEVAEGNVSAEAFIDGTINAFGTLQNNFSNTERSIGDFFTGFQNAWTQALGGNGAAGAIGDFIQGTLKFLTENIDLVIVGVIALGAALGAAALISGIAFAVTQFTALVTLLAGIPALITGLISALGTLSAFLIANPIALAAIAATAAIAGISFAAFKAFTVDVAETNANLEAAGADPLPTNRTFNDDQLRVINRLADELDEANDQRTRGGPTATTTIAGRTADEIRRELADAIRQGALVGGRGVPGAQNPGGAVAVGTDTGPTPEENAFELRVLRFQRTVEDFDVDQTIQQLDVLQQEYNLLPEAAQRFADRQIEILEQHLPTAYDTAYREINQEIIAVGVETAEEYAERQRMIAKEASDAILEEYRLVDDIIDSINEENRNDLEARVQEYNQQVRELRQGADGFLNPVKAELASLVETGEVSFARLRDSIISNIAQQAFDAVAQRGTNALIGAILGPIPANQGADFLVGGRGGVDRNYLPLAVSRGERVQVTPANQVTEGSGNNMRPIQFIVPVSDDRYGRYNTSPDGEAQLVQIQSENAPIS